MIIGAFLRQLDEKVLLAFLVPFVYAGWGDPDVAPAVGLALFARRSRSRSPADDRG